MARNPGVLGNKKPLSTRITKGQHAGEIFLKCYVKQLVLCEALTAEFILGFSSAVWVLLGIKLSPVIPSTAPSVSPHSGAGSIQDKPVHALSHPNLSFHSSELSWYGSCIHFYAGGTMAELALHLARVTPLDWHYPVDWGQVQSKYLRMNRFNLCKLD